uniref:RING-type domain-containing protein n=1 Tax=Caenorhabditis tropicalis TaxID=1561998 RepID=A0A1I7V3H8_9PELO
MHRPRNHHRGPEERRAVHIQAIRRAERYQQRVAAAARAELQAERERAHIEAALREENLLEMQAIRMNDAWRQVPEGLRRPLNVQDLLHPPPGEEDENARGNDQLYYKSIARDMTARTSCQFCKSLIPSKSMITHIDKCSKATDYQMKLIAVERIKSSQEELNYALYKIREKCEMSFFEAHLNKAKLANMECRTCKSFQIHLDGGCMENHQKEVFLHEANKVAMINIAHYEQMLELEKQNQTNERFAKELTYADMADLQFGQRSDLDFEHQRQDAWRERKENSINQTKERNEFLEEITKAHRGSYNFHVFELRKTISSFANNMVKFIGERKNQDLEAFLRMRKQNMIDQCIQNRLAAMRDVFDDDEVQAIDIDQL